MIAAGDLRAAAALFLVALFPRILSLAQPSLATDEVRWIERGDRFVTVAREGFARGATAHLMHPGVPPAAAIGAAGRLGRKLGIDPVVSARLPQALTGAVTPPLLYLAAANPFGRAAAGLAALFLAFDPRHLAVSRTAHLDVIFAVFYLAALWGLTRPANDDAPLPFLVGGFGFGLAMATRTSAALVVPTWIAWSLVAALRWRRPPFRAREGWQMLIALAVFVLTFAKVLLPPAAIPSSSRYPRVPAAERLVDLAAAHPAPIVLVSLLLLAAAALVRRSRGGPLLALGGGGLLASVAVPDLIRNLAGFAVNLVTSPERLHHAYYGEKGIPPPGGFLTVILDGLPAIVLAGLAVGLVVLTLRAARSESTEEGGPPLIVLLGILVFLLIGAEVPKVAFRYLMPITPLLCLTAAAGWTIPFGRRDLRIAGLACVALAVPVAVSVLPEAPHYGTWSSLAGERVRERVDIERHYAAEGHEEAAEWLWDHAHPDDRVSAYCYADVLQYYWHEVIPARRGVPPRPSRIGWFPPDEADFVVVSVRRRRTVGRRTAAVLASREPALRVIVRDDTVMEVYDLREPPAPVQPNTSAANSAITS